MDLNFANKFGFGGNQVLVLESANNINTNLGLLLGSSPTKPIRVYVLSNPDCFVIHHQFDPKKPILQIERKENGPGKINRLNAQEMKALLKGYLASSDGYILVGILKIPTGVYLCVATDCRIVGKINQHEILCISETAFLPFGNRYYNLRTNDINEFTEKQNMEKSHTEIRKWLNSNSFYYSHTYNLTVRAQEQYYQKTKSGAQEGHLLSQVDIRFFWNRHALHFFIKNNLQDFIMPIMKGFVQISSCRVNDQNVDLTLISRLSCLRAGTRYNARGVNDDGNVANFVETEQILSSQSRLASFVIIRGSVPVFWEQKMVRGKYRSTLSRGKEATAPAFAKHFEDTMKIYGRQCIVNLLSPLKESEKTLIDAYEEQLKAANYSENQIKYHAFDFSQQLENGKKFNLIGPLLLDNLETDLLEFGSFILDQDGNVLLSQKGTFRVNCLDCLDRTNVSQSAISLRSLRTALHLLNIVPLDQNTDSINLLNDIARDMWANNGDALSIAYTGTGALKSALTKTGKLTLGGFVDDGVKSVMRSYQNAFRDNEKQDIIDQFLGTSYQNITEEIEEEQDFLTVQLRDREHEFATLKEVTVFVGTWNVGGQAPGENLGGWLSNVNPCPSEPDIYVVAFQEVVELNSKSVWNADETNGQLWHKQILEYLATVHKKKFIILRSYQLVGLLLTVFAPESEIHNFRDVCSEIAKVGFKGIAGNKGSISIRFDYHATSFCFTAAHLAAGQQAVEERNRDYQDIITTTAFRTSKGRRNILDHDHVFFFGDLNYRLNAEYFEVRKLISEQNFETLYLSDQLKAEMEKGVTLKGFTEGPLTFAPTYRYDIGTDVYDTSEKKRKPAWCDRILFLSNDIKQYNYKAGSLMTSDHKPVSAVFGAPVKIIDKSKRDAIVAELTKTLGNISLADGTNIEPQNLLDFDTSTVTTANPPSPVPSQVPSGPASDPLPRQQPAVSNLANPFLDLTSSNSQSSPPPLPPKGENSAKVAKHTPPLTALPPPPIFHPKHTSSTNPASHIAQPQPQMVPIQLEDLPWQSATPITTSTSLFDDLTFAFPSTQPLKSNSQPVWNPFETPQSQNNLLPQPTTQPAQSSAQSAANSEDPFSIFIGASNSTPISQSPSPTIPTLQPPPPGSSRSRPPKKNQETSSDMFPF